MPTTKKQAIDVIKKMSDKATWDDIMYEIYVRKKIAAGIKAADEGRVIHARGSEETLPSMTRLEWTDPAIADLENIQDYLSKDSD